MKNVFRNLAWTLFLALAFAAQHPVSAAPWLTAYYCTWTLASPTPDQLDLKGVTHLIFFTLNPNADGTLSDPKSAVAANAEAVKSAAHKAKAKVLICIGAGDSQAAFEGAISPANQGAFIQNIAAWVDLNGYDGVDIDMEPIPASDAAAYQSFIRALRAALGRHKVLTAAVEPFGDPTIFVPIQKEFDQINIMTYDLSGPWQGWCSWYNSNLYSAGKTMPSNGRPMPSCDLDVTNYISAGIIPSKLAIAASFFGRDWSGVTASMQDITGATIQDITYEQIIDKYYDDADYHWDPDAHAAYLSLRTTTPVQFISYDNPQLCQDKAQYVLSKKLGGLMCWNIGQQYFPNLPNDQQNPLLTAVYTALKTSAKK